MSSSPVLVRPRAALAALVSLLLVWAGVAVALPAAAEGTPALTATVASADADGIRVRAVGAGLSPDTTGVYVALIERGAESEITGSGGYAAFQWVRSVVDGGFTVDLSAASGGLDRTAAYEILVWRQHTNPDAGTILTRGDVAIGDDTWDAVFGPAEEPAAPTIVTSVAEVSATSGVTVRVVGSRFGEIAGAYAAIIEKGTESSVSAGGGYVAFGYWMTPGAITGGAFDKTLVAPAAQLDRAKAYEVIVWQGHSTPDASTIYARADVVLTDAQWNVLFPPVPRVSVSKTSGLDAAGETITISGSGFVPSPPATSGTRPPLAGKFTGAYVVVGAFADVWKPSAGAPSSARAQAVVTKWGVLAEDMVTIGGADRGAIAIGPDGTFSVTVTVSKNVAYTSGNWGVYTYPGGGAAYAPFETYTPLSFATAVPPTEPEQPAEPVSPANPVLPAAPVAVDGGFLRWGVHSPFTDYVSGPIAHGRVAAVDEATANGTVFQFGQAAASTYDPTSESGSVSYRGGVHYYGHDGALDLTISNPEIRFAGPGSATLLLSSGGSTVAFAALDVAAASRIENNGAYTYSNVPATLTAAGAALFQGNYPAGQRLDPVTFTIGSPAAAPSGSTGTVALASTGGASSPASVPAAAPLTAISTDACTVAGATLTWGFKESFRTYVEGIAAGGWELTGVTYAYPDYIWNGGTGSMEKDASRGLVTYGGSIRFTGHDGALDTTLANARVEFAGASGYLVFDVSGTTQAGAPIALKDVRLAQFSADAAQVAGATVTLTGVSVTLTDAGAAAFGTYPSGTQLDPVSATIPVGATCGVAATTGAASGTAGAAAAENGVTSSSASEGGSLVWLWILVGAVVLLAIVAVVWVALARRRAA